MCFFFLTFFFYWNSVGRRVWPIQLSNLAFPQLNGAFFGNFAMDVQCRSLQKWYFFFGEWGGGGTMHARGILRAGLMQTQLLNKRNRKRMHEQSILRTHISRAYPPPVPEIPNTQSPGKHLPHSPRPMTAPPEPVHMREKKNGKLFPCVSGYVYLIKTQNLCWGYCPPPWTGGHSIVL